jgi:hypothetical protein
MQSPRPDVVRQTKKVRGAFPDDAAFPRGFGRSAPRDLKKKRPEASLGLGAFSNV